MGLPIGVVLIGWSLNNCMSADWGELLAHEQAPQASSFIIFFVKKFVIGHRLEPKPMAFGTYDKIERASDQLLPRIKKSVLLVFNTNICIIH
jgi:hypothetical protein